MSERYYLFSLRMLEKYSQSKTAKQKKTSHDEVSKRSRVALSKKNHSSKEGKLRHLEKSCNSWKSLILPSLTIRHYMEEFVLVSASVYNNKCLNTQTVTKQELPRYHVDKNPTNQIDSLKKEINRKLCVKAGPLVFGLSPSSSLWQNFVLSSYQHLNSTDFKIGWCWIWNFIVRLCSTTSSLKRTFSRCLLDFTWHCW